GRVAGRLEAVPRHRPRKAADIPGEDLRRREDVAAAFPLLRLRPVLVGAAVFRAVLLRDPFGGPPVHAGDPARATLDHHRGGTAFRAHGDPRLARDVARPLRIGAAFEVPAVIDPRAPLTDQVGLAIGVDGHEPVGGGALEEAARRLPRDHAGRAVRDAVALGHDRPFRTRTGRAQARVLCACARVLNALLLRPRPLRRHLRTHRYRTPAPPP